jgi:hypothetical protein
MMYVDESTKSGTVSSFEMELANAAFVPIVLDAALPGDRIPLVGVNHNGSDRTFVKRMRGCDFIWVRSIAQSCCRVESKLVGADTAFVPLNARSGLRVWKIRQQGFRCSTTVLAAFEQCHRPRECPGASATICTDCTLVA